jgi:hypothetical protein
MRFGVFLGILFSCAVVSFLSARIVVLTAEVDQTKQTTRAVCLFRDGLYRDAKTTKEYALAHPEGIPSLHYTQKVLLHNAALELTRANTLKGLRC